MDLVVGMKGMFLGVVLAVLACGAGEIRVPFYTIQDVPRLKAFKGRDCAYCNVGSNTGFYGFDWASAGVNGANFATGPQSLAQGFALLEHFADRLAKGCTVFIPICPFSSIASADRYGPDRQYVLYPFVDGKDIPQWTPEHAAAVEKAVAEAEAKWTGVEPRLAGGDAVVTPEEFRKSAENLLACWRREFAITDFAAPLGEANRASFAKNAAALRKGLEKCKARGWRPILVLPPVSRYYDGVFTDAVWKQYVDDFVAAARVEGVPYWDYSRDERFRDDANFRDSLMLNHRGAKAFTAEVLRRSGCEPSVFAELRRELRAFYPDECHGVCKDPRQPASSKAIGDGLDAWAMAHPGFDALDIRRESYLLMRRHFVPFLFDHSPFYFEAGVNGGWSIWDGTKAVPARHVNRICGRFYREQGLVPSEAEKLLWDRTGQRFLLCCGPFVDDMHHVPPFHTIFTKGFRGVRDEVVAAIAKCPEDDPLGRKQLETALVGLDTIHDIQLKFAEAAEERLARGGLDARGERNFRRIATAARRCPWEPPRDFYEGLNALWFIREITGYVDGLCNFSLGRPDAWLIDFYRADIASGRLTRAEAKELLGAFLLTSDCHLDTDLEIDTHSDQEAEMPLTLGGCDAKGDFVWNELTEMLLDAHLELDLVFPKLHCRIASDAPSAYLRKIGGMLMKDHAVFALFNDDRHVPQFEAMGYPKDRARDFVCTGCWDGNVDSMTDVDCANYMSVARILELTIHRDREVERRCRVAIDPIDGAKSFEEVRDALYRNFIRFFRHALSQYVRYGRSAAKVFPHPTYSVCLEGGIETRRDTTDGGVRFRPRVVTLAFMANVVDSLCAIRKLCFEDRFCTLDEMLAAVRANWKGARAQEIRQAVFAAPYWGDGSKDSCGLMKWWIDRVADDLAGYTNDQGGPFVLACWIYREFVDWAKNTKATPDGRADGDRLAQGFAPSEYRCKADWATVLNAIGELDHTRLFASNANLMFDKETMNEAVWEAVFRVVCQKDMHLLQPNCTSVEDLIDAQVHPERHHNLIVKVCGFSARFTSLSKRWQDEVIARHRLK